MEKAHCMNCDSLQLQKDINYLGDGKYNCPNCKLDTWTVTVQMTVFAGDMDKANVISNADDLLKSITDGTDFAGYSIVDAVRDTL